jgi:hypothetical protein
VRSPERPRVLFIGGSVNQTRQMHQIAGQLGEVEAHFTPYYADGVVEQMRRWGLTDRTIIGPAWRKECLNYLQRAGLRLDHEGRGHDYQLVVTCSDLFVPRNIRGKKIVLCQEGMMDDARVLYWLRRALPILPRWIAGTAFTGSSGHVTRFCVASEGYRRLFASRGVPADIMVVTGIPNFDDCARYLKNDFPHHGYFLVCTSDARETFKLDHRARFLRQAVALARGRRMVFKLHPNEDWGRSTREIRQVAPDALIFTSGSAEEMVANSAELMCQYSSLAFVALALGKPVHSYHDCDELRRLLPRQGGHAAREIADVCREQLGLPRVITAPALEAAS